MGGYHVAHDCFVYTSKLVLYADRLRKTMADDDVHEAIYSIYHVNLARLILYARWRIAQHRWGSNRAEIMPGGADCYDMVHDALLHLLTTTTEDDIQRRSPDMTADEEIYRKFKRRIDTQVRNINSRSETDLVEKVDNYDAIDSTSTNLQLSAIIQEERLMSDDFLQFIQRHSSDILLFLVAEIAIYEGIISPRDQAEKLKQPVTAIYEARRRLKILLKKYLRDPDPDTDDADPDDPAPKNTKGSGKSVSLAWSRDNDDIVEARRQSHQEKAFGERS